MKRFSLVVSCVASLLVSGCSLIIDSEPYVGNGPPDAGADAGSMLDSGMADAGPPRGCDSVEAPADTVIGFWSLRYVSATSEEHVPQDLSAFTVQAYIPEEDGFRVVNGAGTTDGTFRIEGVPEGVTYYLKVFSSGAPTYHVTNLRCVELDRYVGGRADAETVSLTQPMELHFDNLQPFALGDWLVAEVFNTSTEVWNLEGVLETQTGEPAVEAGSTQLDATFDLGCMGNCYSYRLDGRPALLDATRGDALQLAHARARVMRDGADRLVTVGYTIDLADVEGLTTTSGATTVVNGSFAPVEQNETLRFTISRALYDAGYTDGMSQFTGITMAVYGSPGADRGVNIGVPIPSLEFNDWHGTAPRMSTVDVTYGDPLPEAWPRLLDIRYTRLRWYRVPGTNISRFLPLSIGRFARPTTPLQATPPLLPPTNIRVGGMPAVESGRVAFDGSAPVTVSWNPVANVNVYAVQVFRFFADGIRTQRVSAGIIETTETSVDIPAEVFGGGEFFAFLVTAFQDGGLYAQGLFNLQPYPNGSASNATGLLRLDAHCGDGTRQAGAGEECDTAGTATADCDVDCTTPVCGDGITNTLADEECDTGTESAGCDPDCTLPVCGDNFVNPEVEDCDDGNAQDDGNGCDANCRSYAVCGDGARQETVEDCDDGNNQDDANGCSTHCHSYASCGDGIHHDAIEQCDTGGDDTATCVGSTCRTSVCGDGYANAAAMEVCDDLNGSDGDGCSANCRSTETCGNGIRDTAVGEVCDDGNNIDGDGCSSDCRSGDGCGNGVVDTAFGEQCDDGNTTNGDGCSTTCQLECRLLGATCTTAAQCCSSFCSSGVCVAP
jgi:cysteine-rich repeat protein